MFMDKHQVVIIGAGPAGVTAAIYALRSGCEVLVIEKMMVGGQVATCADIRNFPAIDHLDGLKWSRDTRKQVEDLGGKFLFDEVLDIHSKNHTLTLKNSTIEYDALVLALGAKPKKLGCPGEQQFVGRGVSYCATCDGALYKDKDVIVVGGGNTAFEDAKYLSNICKNVHMLIRKSAPRAISALQEEVTKSNNITIHYLTNLIEIKGDSKVESAVIDTDGKQSILPVSAVFLAIGRGPDTEMLQGVVDMDDNGYIITDSQMSTSTPGIYACGDVRVTTLRQIVTATADGALAGLAAAKYVKLKKG